MQTWPLPFIDADNINTQLIGTTCQFADHIGYSLLTSPIIPTYRLQCLCRAIQQPLCMWLFGPAVESAPLWWQNDELVHIAIEEQDSLYSLPTWTSHWDVMAALNSIFLTLISHSPRPTHVRISYILSLACSTINTPCQPQQFHPVISMTWLICLTKCHMKVALFIRWGTSQNERGSLPPGGEMRGYVQSAV